MEQILKDIYVIGTWQIDKMSPNKFYIIFSHWYVYSGLEKKYIPKFSSKNFYEQIPKDSKILFLANSEEEEENLLKFFSREQVIFCSRHFNHCYKDDGTRTFYDLNLEKEYDFIFNGGHNKNQEVLKYLDNLCIVDKRFMEPRVKCSYYNDIKLTHKEVNILVNKSKIGIMTTPTEGASWASLEFLLCGIPVVSCKSKGGRDVFYTKNNSVIFNSPKFNKEEYAKILKEVCYETLDNISKFNKDIIIKETIKMCDEFKYKLVNILNDIHGLGYDTILEAVNKCKNFRR